MKRLEAKITIDGLLGNSSGSYSINTFINQVNHLYHEKAVTHDRGEVVVDDR